MLYQAGIQEWNDTVIVVSVDGVLAIPQVVKRVCRKKEKKWEREKVGKRKSDERRSEGDKAKGV
jgi:hypothetical protein